MADNVKIGDTIECAFWLTGEETQEHIRRWMEDDCPMALESLVERMIIGPVTFTTKRPGEDRVPQVPDHVSGPDVRLLVAEADVVGFRPEIKHTSFLADLEPKDLERLRVATRKAHRKTNPGARLTDWQVDRIIEEIGPDAAANAVRQSVSAWH